MLNPDSSSRRSLASCLVLPGVLTLGLAGFGLTVALGGVGLGLMRPAIAQRLTDVTPAVNGTDVSPDASISGVFDASEGGSLNPGSVRILLNNQDVTGRSTISRGFFSYRPERPLEPGSYTVQVDYANTQGQRRSTTWGFTVPSQVSVSLQNVTHNAATALDNGSTFLATLTGTRGAKASVLLIDDKRAIQELNAQEVSPGVYVATVIVKATSAVQERVVVGQLALGNRKAIAAASQPALWASLPVSPPTPTSTPTATPTPTPTVTPASTPGAINPKPNTPSFSSHKTGDRITTQGFVLQGSTSPNATVRIKVTASTPLLGGVINLGGDVLVDKAVVADSAGQFKVDVPAPVILQRGVRYTVEATATLNNQTSGTTKLTLEQR